MAKTSGSGWGKYRKGRDIESITQVRRKDILLEHSKEFQAKNIVRITHTDRKRGIVYGIYVDPDNPCKKRLSSDRDFTILDFDLLSGKYSKPVKGKRAKCERD